MTFFRSARFWPASRSVIVMGMLALHALAADRPKVRTLADDDADLNSAKQALADGCYDIAELKLRRLQSRPNQGPKHRSLYASLLVESLVRDNKGSEALAAMQNETIEDRPFWEGQARLLTGEYDRAVEVLSTYPAEGPLAALATVARAHALMGEGREAAARSLIKPLRANPDAGIARHTRLLFNELELGNDSPQVLLDRLSSEGTGKDMAVQYLRARALLEQNDEPKAEAILRDMLSTDQLSELQYDASTLLLAEVLWHQRSPEARKRLVSFINSFSNGTSERKTTEFWSEAFGLLERIAANARPDDPMLASALQWAADSTRPLRQGYALHFVAQQLHKAGRDDYAIGFIEAIIQLQPKHPKVSDAMRLAMQIHGAMRCDPRVIELAELWRRDFGGGGESVVDFLVGMIRFTRGEYHEALTLFAKAADLEGDLSRRRRALYNAAMCAVKAGEKAVLASLMTQLAQAAPTGDQGKKGAGESVADVELDRALQLAAKVDPAAGEELGNFIKSYPEHPRWAEAQVALAEFSLLDVPPRIKPATEALDAATKTKLAPALQERIDYVRLWLREATQDLPAVARASEAFIKAWPNSSRTDEVRMKAGEAYYRLENFLSARAQFELLVKNSPESPYADTALFFAGKAAMKLGGVGSVEWLNAAITTWEELSQREGPLAAAARQQQAIAKRLQGNNLEALKLLDDLLDNPQTQGDQRFGILCDKAELLVGMGRTEAKRFDEAAKLLRGMLEDKALPFAWSARAGVLLALALKDQSHSTEALEACYDVVNNGTNFLSQPSTPTEYQWFYRAGFLAVDLLKEGQKWEAAAKMAEKLAQTGGDRAKEAAEKATEIRLKHFLWDGKK